MARIVKGKKRVYIASAVLLVGLFTLASFSSLFASLNVSIADFEIEDIGAWDVHTFNKETEYLKVKMDDRWVLKATSADSSSLLIKKQRVDLRQTPFLNWRWRVDTLVTGVDERTTRGDDFSARVNVIIDGGFFFWDTRTLNYVWSSHQARGSHWPSPFSDNAQMIAVESGDEHRGEWMVERRNVYEDLKHAFGEDLRYIDAVAIMTDSDNSDGQAQAYYGNIYFSSQ